MKKSLLVLSRRLQFSQFKEKENHPWILPNKSNFVKLLVKEAHKRVYLFGVVVTLTQLRERYFK